MLVYYDRLILKHPNLHNLPDGHPPKVKKLKIPILRELILQAQDSLSFVISLGYPP